MHVSLLGEDPSHLVRPSQVRLPGKYVHLGRFRLGIRPVPALPNLLLRLFLFGHFPCFVSLVPLTRSAHACGVSMLPVGPGLRDVLQTFAGPAGPQPPEWAWVREPTLRNSFQGCILKWVSFVGYVKSWKQAHAGYSTEFAAVSRPLPAMALQRQAASDSRSRARAHVLASRVRRPGTAIRS